jgi:hypothetical protein
VFAVTFVREHDECQLALRVRAPPIVVAHQHHVLEVDRSLPNRGDVDDSCRSASTNRRQQQVRQQKGRKIVDGKPEFVASAAGCTAFTWRTEANAGVVDQQIDALVRICNLADELPDLDAKSARRNSTPRLPVSCWIS